MNNTIKMFLNYIKINIKMFLNYIKINNFLTIFGLALYFDRLVKITNPLAFGNFCHMLKPLKIFCKNI